MSTDCLWCKTFGTHPLRTQQAVTLLSWGSGALLLLPARQEGLADGLRVFGRRSLWSCRGDVSAFSKREVGKDTHKSDSYEPQCPPYDNPQNHPRSVERSGASHSVFLLLSLRSQRIAQGAL